MATTPEGKVKENVKRLFIRYEGIYYFMPVQMGYGAPGLDFHCCYRGRAFFVETKAPGARLTPRQLRTAEAVMASGGAFFLVRDSATLKELEDWLTHVKETS